MYEEAYGSISKDEEEEEGEPTSEPSMMNSLMGELVGTATLVQIGCGGVCSALYLGTMDGLWEEAAIWVLGATLAVYIAAPLSGAHLNPAVTLSFAIIRPDAFHFINVIPYWFAQLLGGFLAGAINLVLFDKAIRNFEAENDLVRGVHPSHKSAAAFGNYWMDSPGVDGTAQAILIEAFGTSFLTFVIFAVTNPKNSIPSTVIAPIVGAAIGCMISLLGGLTGAGINPARDLGPRAVTLIGGWGSEAMENFLPYTVGPLIGGPIGAALADLMLYRDY